jgi:hypothetical protein
MVDDMKKRILSNRSGMAMVEFALILPLLMLLLLGTMEMGWMFFRMHEISSIAREAARVAIRPDSTNATVATRVSGLTEDLGFDTYTLTVVPDNIAALNAGQQIQVTLEVPYSEAGLFSTGLVRLPGTLRARATMAKEGAYGGS